MFVLLEKCVDHFSGAVFGADSLCVETCLLPLCLTVMQMIAELVSSQKSLCVCV